MCGKSRNKSYQLIVERNTASLVLVQAILTKSDRKVASSADVMHTSAQMTLKIHHHQIGDGHALTVSVGGKFGCLQCCSSFRGSSSIWGASAWSAAKMASQPPNLHSIPKNDPWNSILIYQTRIFCKKNGLESSILPEIEVQTFYYPLYAVTTACCVPWQIPVRNMKEHSREIC